MAKFRVLVPGAHRVSVPSADLDVKDGVVDTTQVEGRARRAQVEAELRSTGLVDENVKAAQKAPAGGEK